MECQKEKNLGNCNCSYNCPKKGLCCECLRKHLKNRELPACFFPKEIEKVGERSFERFAELVDKNRI